VWLLIALVVLALAATIVYLLRRRSRMRAWAARFETAKGEVVWLARERIPQLGSAPTAEQMAGGWRVTADRVTAAEDQLTALEAEATDETGRARARTLRDAVRASRSRLDALAGTRDTAAASNELHAASAMLERALASVEPPPQ
jgi:hypothetical protein